MNLNLNLNPTPPPAATAQAAQTAAECQANDSGCLYGPPVDGPFLELLDRFGYTPLLPANVVVFPRLHVYLHVLVGLLTVGIGLPGLYLNLKILNLHRTYPKALLDPSGLLLVNFLLANVGYLLFQLPMTGIASFTGSWPFGRRGCEFNGFSGLLFSHGIIWSLLLLFLDRYLMTSDRPFVSQPLVSRGKSYFLLLSLLWTGVLLFICLPPSTGFVSRFTHEPAGTACNLDYWHNDYRFYYAYVSILVLVGFILPMAVAIFLLTLVIPKLNMIRCDDNWTKSVALHHQGMTKFCAMSLISVVACWSPQVLLYLWPLAFDGAASLNIYYTLWPPIIAKMSPLLTAWNMLQMVPRIREAHLHRRGHQMPQSLSGVEPLLNQEQPSLEDSQ